MDITTLVSEIDAEISRLQDARAAIAALAGPATRGPGRPSGSSVKNGVTKRMLSPEARAKIAAAQKKRWAAAKKDQG